MLYLVVAFVLYGLLYAIPSILRLVFYKAGPPRVVLVTGASGGLGKLTAEAIATAFPGCFVYGTSRKVNSPLI